MVVSTIYVSTATYHEVKLCMEAIYKQICRIFGPSSRVTKERTKENHDARYNRRRAVWYSARGIETKQTRLFCSHVQSNNQPRAGTGNQKKDELQKKNGSTPTIVLKIRVLATLNYHPLPAALAEAPFRKPSTNVAISSTRQS